MQMRRLLVIGAVIFFTGCAATLGVSFYSDHFVKQPHPLATFWDRSRSVAMGVYNDSDFANVQLVVSPHFDFQVHGDLIWSIRFELGVRPEGSARLPKVVVFVPRDASNCRSGYGFSVNDGRIQRMPDSDVSIISERESTAENKVFEVSPRLLLTGDRKYPTPHVRYVLECETKLLNTTPAGLGAKNFEIDYIPSQAASKGVRPGLGALNRGQLRLSYASNMHDDFSRDDVNLNPGKLVPEPEGIGDSSYFWDVPDELTRLSVQGTVSQPWISKVSTAGNWFLGFLAATVAAIAWNAVKDSLARKKKKKKKKNARKNDKGKSGKNVQAKNGKSDKLKSGERAKPRPSPGGRAAR
jgi:hypothetical protein